MDSLSNQAIEVLFQTFARRWGAKWDRTFNDKKARSLWLHDLKLLAVTDESMRTGLIGSTDLEWPPSPAEFAKLCQASDGLPDVDTAYRRAVVAHWSHPVVYEAASRVGVFELRNWPESKSRPAYERAYKQVCTEWRTGTRFETPKRPALEHQPKPCDPAIAKAQLEKIKAMLSRNTQQAGI